jgi:hypothetical protein
MHRSKKGIDIEGDEFGRHGPEALGLFVGETVFEDDVATLDVAELGELRSRPRN